MSAENPSAAEPCRSPASPTGRRSDRGRISGAPRGGARTTRGAAVLRRSREPRLRKREPTRGPDTPPTREQGRRAGCVAAPRRSGARPAGRRADPRPISGAQRAGGRNKPSAAELRRSREPPPGTRSDLGKTRPHTDSRTRARSPVRSGASVGGGAGGPEVGFRSDRRNAARRRANSPRRCGTRPVTGTRPPGTVWERPDPAPSRGREPGTPGVAEPRRSPASPTGRKSDPGPIPGAHRGRRPKNPSPAGFRRSPRTARPEPATASGRPDSHRIRRTSATPASPRRETRPITGTAPRNRERFRGHGAPPRTPGRPRRNASPPGASLMAGRAPGTRRGGREAERGRGGPEDGALPAGRGGRHESAFFRRRIPGLSPGERGPRCGPGRRCRARSSSAAPGAGTRWAAPRRGLPHSPGSGSRRRPRPGGR